MLSRWRSYPNWSWTDALRDPLGAIRRLGAIAVVAYSAGTILPGISREQRRRFFQKQLESLLAARKLNFAEYFAHIDHATELDDLASQTDLAIQKDIKGNKPISGGQYYTEQAKTEKSEVAAIPLLLNRLMFIWTAMYICLGSLAYPRLPELAHCIRCKTVASAIAVPFLAYKTPRAARYRHSLHFGASWILLWLPLAFVWHGWYHSRQSIITEQLSSADDRAETKLKIFEALSPVPFWSFFRSAIVGTLLFFALQKTLTVLLTRCRTYSMLRLLGNPKRPAGRPCFGLAREYVGVWPLNELASRKSLR